MFDLRYHVASLAAVFLALIIGILVGVGLSDNVDKASNSLLEREVANLRRQLDDSSQQKGSLAREQAAALKYIKLTYPALARNRLRGKSIALVFVGSRRGAVSTAVNRALADASGRQLRMRAIKVPIDVRQIDAALASNPDGKTFAGPGRFEALGRTLGEELTLGGETPLWNALTDTTSLVEEKAGGNKDPADGVVVVRTAPPQRDGTSRFLLGLYAGLGSAGVPAIGVEVGDARNTAVPVFRETGLSSVDNVDTLTGRLALVLLLDGAPSGQYGLKQSADDGALPPLATGG